MKSLIDKLEKDKTLSPFEFAQLLEEHDATLREYAYARARKVAKQHFNNKIFIRGLIEFSNVCHRNCLYCGIRKDNANVKRYFLDTQTILACCEEAYALGFRTFVLQSGELDNTCEDTMVECIGLIKAHYPDCAITLSMGEKPKEVYEAYYKAGADRYLLRHETSNPIHYEKLHPKGMQVETRKKCLQNLKEIGFQVGSGMMIGSPYQRIDNIIEDFYYLQELQPAMIGMGPYLPHEDTPFYEQPAGDLDLTLFVLALLRLQFPTVLLPSTTALASLVENGRELGILAGANVVMPNISPQAMREHYSLYDHKASSGAEAKEGLEDMKKRMQAIGYEVVIDRGDYKG